MTETRWLDESQQQAWRGYLQMQSRLSARLNRQLQTDSDLSLADFDVLVALTDQPEDRLRVSELARALQWEKSRLSHHVGRMERRGLVAREECAADGRGAFVVLTTEGRRTIEAAAPPHVAAVRRLVFDHLTPEQVATLDTIARDVLGRLETEE
jgi:DNA-binding MarR family transcriptional regulator